MSEKKSIYTIYDDNKAGKVQISEAVLAVIATIAAADVEGISVLKGDMDRAQISRADARTIGKVAKVRILDGCIKVQMILNIKYGYSIPDASQAVQEKVKENLENMTGIRVDSVHVSIADVIMNKAGKSAR